MPAPSKTLLGVMLAAFLAVIAGVPAWQVAHELAVEGEAPHMVSFFTAAPTKKHLHAWDQAARDRSVVAKAIRQRTLQWQYDLFRYAGPKAIAGRSEGGWLFYTPDVQYLLGPAWNEKRFLHGRLDTMVAGRKINTRNPLHAIVDWRDKLKARGIDLLLVPVPGKPSIYPERLDPSFREPPVSPTEGLIAEMRRLGLDVVDLFEPLRRAKAAAGAAAGPELYLRRDTHWSPAGLEAAAEAVAENVRSRAWYRDTLGGGPRFAVASTGVVGTAAYYLKDVEVERWGDIAEMTKLPRRREIWPAEKVMARQVVGAQGSPYVDVPDSPILFLGDSYARIFQSDAPRSAGLIAHVAYRLGMPLASVVNDGGASTLVRRQLYRKADLLQGKKLVIWEFVERDIRFGEEGWQILDLP